MKRIFPFHLLNLFLLGYWALTDPFPFGGPAVCIERKCDLYHKRRSVGAVCSDPAFVGTCDPLSNGQPQAVASGMAAPGGVYAVKTVKEVGDALLVLSLIHI